MIGADARFAGDQRKCKSKCRSIGKRAPLVKEQRYGPALAGLAASGDRQPTGLDPVVITGGSDEV